MSEPLRIYCKTPSSIPAPEELAQQVTPQRHVVLELEYSEAWSEPLKELAGALAETFPELSVFVSGPRSVTLLWVVPTAALEPHLEELRRAVDLFTQTARTLVERLASVLQISSSQLGEGWRLGLTEEQCSGCIDDRWEYFFHGREVQFQDLQTGSILDVRLTSWGRPEALLDPFFVGQFLRSTPGFEPLARLLRDPYHDTSRALALLRSRSPRA